MGREGTLLYRLVQTQFPPAEEAAAHSGHSGHSSKGHVVDVLIFEGTYICDAPRTSSF